MSTPTVICIASSIPAAAAARLDEPHHPLERPHRVVAQAESEREVEQVLGVGAADDLGVELRFDGQHHLAFDRPKPLDQAVVDEQRVGMPERVAVGLLHRRPIAARTCAIQAGDSSVRVISRRFSSFHAGSVER